MSERSLNPFRIIAKELPRWWRDARDIGDSMGTVTLPDVVEALVPQTPSDVALVVAGGPVGAGVRKAAVGVAGATYAGDTEAAGGAVKAGSKVASKIKSALLRGEKPQKYSGDALKEIQPQISERYPQIGEPVLLVDKKTGRQFLSKGDSIESQIVADARKAAQAEIDAGNYTPFFDVSKRFYADPSLTPVSGNPLTDAVPKTAAKRSELSALYDTPEFEKRALAAFDSNAHDPLKKDWYAVGQLQKAFMDELGPVEGARAFKERFADAMAATTGGADPTSNYLMAQYGNYMRNRGARAAEKSYELPYPVGGRYASGNMEMYNRHVTDAVPLSAANNPKRFSFRNNFLGDRNAFTVDEQMMKLVDPSGRMMAPRPGHYGPINEAFNRVAALRGVLPANFQEVAWHHDKTTGKPMIQVVNEAIERTSRVTGMTPEEVLRESIIRARRPTYGVGAGGLALATEDEGQ